MNMKIGSLFDGSGTAPLAAAMLGWEPVWASEIEKYPMNVTKARFPKMVHLGDITQIDGAAAEPVDVIVGGSPCQDLSVAGKQAGLHGGKRSHLFFEMTRIVREMREATNAKYPRFVVWENVPGAFSSNKGRDFHAVVAEFCTLADGGISIPGPAKWRNAGAVVGDGWSFAWRILDAKHWGVPQARRRIFAVLDFDSERAGEILFERAGLPGHFEPGAEAGKADSGDAMGCSYGSGGIRCLNPEDSQAQRIYDADGVYPALAANESGGQNRQAVIYPGNQITSPANRSNMRPGDACPTLAKSGAENMIAVIHPADGTIGALCARADSSPCVDRGQPFVAMFTAGQGEKAGGIGYSEDAAPTLRAQGGLSMAPTVVYKIHDKATRNKGGGDTRNNDGAGNGLGVADPDAPMYTITAMDRHAVVYDARGNGDGEIVPTITGDHQNRVTDYTSLAVYGVDARNGALIEDASPTMQAKESGGQSLNAMPPVLYTQQRIGEYADCGRASAQTARQFKSPSDLIVQKKHRFIIRRLTPLGCCRLQGFPDWWTDGVPGSDTAQYKMWGNGMALPCMLAVLNGISCFVDANKSSDAPERAGKDGENG